jgi:hypothetical protein
MPDTAHAEFEGIATRWSADSSSGPVLELIGFTDEASVDPSIRKRVARLLDLQARAADHGLVPLAGGGELNGRLFVTRRVPPPAATLRHRLHTRGPIDPKASVAVLLQLVEALTALRASKLPHGILTTASIAVHPQDPGRTLLCDYGFRPLPGQACARQDLVARAEYLAPEVITGGAAGPAATVYALACIFMECLTGQPPFVRDRPVAVLDAHLSETPPLISERCPGAPAALDEAVAVALDKLPEARHPSPLAFVVAVQEALGIGRATEAEPVAPPAELPAPAPAEDGGTSASRGARRRAWAKWRRPLASGAGIGTMVMAAGLAAGMGGGSTAAKPAAQQLAYTRTVDGAVAKVNDARSALDRAVGDGPRAAEARRVVAAYGQMRQAVGHAPAGVVGAKALVTRLDATRASYRRLASAVVRRDVAGAADARRDVGRREQALQQAIATVGRAVYER